jgi:hypothetical protein
MSNFKFRGLVPAVTKYVKSKPLIQVVAEVFAYGFLMPLAAFAWTVLVYNLITNGVSDTTSFGIYG